MLYQFNVKKQVFFDLSCAYEHCLANVDTRYFLMSCRSGNNICWQLESMCDYKYQELPSGSFLKVYREEYQRNSRDCRERSSSHTCWLLAAARVMVLQVNQLFFICCIRSICVWQIKFDRQMSSGANDRANVLPFAAFRDHGWGHVAVYPSWPHVLITWLFQPSDDLHQFTLNYPCPPVP